MSTPTADIGLIGLAVMGENLVLNMESRGYTVAVFNRTVDKVDAFVNGRGKGKKFIGAHTAKDFIASLKRPRKVMMLVKAGEEGGGDGWFHQDGSPPDGLRGDHCLGRDQSGRLAREVFLEATAAACSWRTGRGMMP